MKKLALFFFIIFSICGQLYSQNSDPDERIIVNKEYDENGNLIGYDSTYIHQWNSDSTQNLDFFDNDFFRGDGFADADQLIQQFFNDSTLKNGLFPFSNPNNVFKQFDPSFTDSVISQGFNLYSDTTIFPHDYIFPDFDEIKKQMEEQFKNFEFPESHTFQDLNEKQKKELEELMQKHSEELENLKKKWNDSNE
jgi:hypothetical protein